MRGKRRRTQTEDESQGSEYVDLPDTVRDDRGAGPVETPPDDQPPPREQEPDTGSG